MNELAEVKSLLKEIEDCRREYKDQRRLAKKEGSTDSHELSRIANGLARCDRAEASLRLLERVFRKGNN